MRLLRSLPMLALAGCVELNPITTPENFDPASVTRLAFRIENSEHSQLQPFDARELDGISREISERFSAAGYPVRNAQKSLPQRSGTTDPGHLLQASVGSPALTDMPVGFTLDFGDSTPRAQNFQKTTTVDIDCRLVDLTGRQTPILLSERKAISARIAKATPNTPENFEKIRRYYVENIGATCHDLLDKLAIQPKRPAADQGEVKDGAWQGMRIQTEYEDESPVRTGASSAASGPPAKSAAPAQELGPRPEKSTGTPEPEARALPEPEHLTPTPLRPAAPASAPVVRTPPANLSKRPESSSIDAPIPSVPERAPAAVPAEQSSRPDPVAMENPPAPAETNAKDAAPTVSTEDNKARDWRKKKITIFNQGNTVILKFGPDR